MQMMYGGFESWLNKYGKDITFTKKNIAFGQGALDFEG